MTWVEILQVGGPIALGGAGIWSGYGIARHQSKSAAEAEARARVFVASADLLAVANQVFFHLSLWRSRARTGKEPPVMTMSPERVLAQANAAAAVCLLHGKPLGYAANHLVACVTGTLALFETGGTVEEGEAVSPELMNAMASFATEAGDAA